MASLPPHLEPLVESICARGCSEVNAFIAALEAGHDRAEVARLPKHEQRVVLRELKAIMRVYEADCDD